MVEIQESIVRPPLAFLGITQTDVRHCTFINRSVGQLISSRVGTPLKNRNQDRVTCTRLYQHAYQEMLGINPYPKVPITRLIN